MSVLEWYAAAAGYPEVYGVEEETGLQVNLGNGWEDPNHLAKNLRYYMPDDIAFAGYFELFIQNGGLIYAGGSQASKDIDNIERATPECSNPEEASAYVQANEKLMVEIAKKYAVHMAQETGNQVALRLQRRVVDSHGNRKGCHDNYGVERPVELLCETKQSALIGHLATRSFITGAGQVTSKGYRFAQKINGLQSVVGYGYDGFMYRVVDNAMDISHDSTGNRVEVRCSDINISPWAVTTRLGSMGLLLACLETPLEYTIRDMSPSGQTISVAKECNTLPMDHDGSLRPNRWTYKSVDFQERLADIFLDDLQLYTDLPIGFYKIAAELKQYCEDYRKVLANELPLSVLSDRSDWAAKFSHIVGGSHERQPLNRHEDFILRARDDLLYDYIGIRVKDDGELKQSVGYGYRLRAKGSFKQTVDTTVVERAYQSPPPQTRANIRGRLIKSYDVSRADWDVAEVRSYQGSLSVDFEQPTTHSLDEQTRVRLESSAVKR